jgi:hypothetical protein
VLFHDCCCIVDKYRYEARLNVNFEIGQLTSQGSVTVTSY